MDKLLSLLNDKNTILVNRQLAACIGLNNAVMYAALVSKSLYYSSRGQDRDGWFYCTINDMHESSSLGARSQKKAADTLCELGLIDLKIMGIPARRFFRINTDTSALEGLLSPAKPTPVSFDKTQELVSSDSANLYPQSGETCCDISQKQADTICTNLYDTNDETSSCEVTNKSNIINLIYKSDIESDIINHPASAPCTEQSAVQNRLAETDDRTDKNTYISKALKESALSFGSISKLSGDIASLISEKLPYSDLREKTAFLRGCIDKTSRYSPRDPSGYLLSVMKNADISDIPEPVSSATAQSSSPSFDIDLIIEHAKNTPLRLRGQ